MILLLRIVYTHHILLDDPLYLLISLHFLMLAWVECGQSTLLDEVKFIDIVGRTHDVLQIHGLSFLLLRDLTADTCKVLDKELGRLGYQN